MVNHQKSFENKPLIQKAARLSCVLEKRQVVETLLVFKLTRCHEKKQSDTYFPDQCVGAEM